MTRFTARSEAIDRAIIPALEPHEDDYDADAIFDATFAWVDGGRDTDGVWQSAGYVQTVTNPEQWWAVVAAHDIS